MVLVNNKYQLQKCTKRQKYNRDDNFKYLLQLSIFKDLMETLFVYVRKACVALNRNVGFNTVNSAEHRVSS